MHFYIQRPIKYRIEEDGIQTHELQANVNTPF